MGLSSNSLTFPITCNATVKFDGWGLSQICSWKSVAVELLIRPYKSPSDPRRKKSLCLVLRDFSMSSMSEHMFRITYICDENTHHFLNLHLQLQYYNVLLLLVVVVLIHYCLSDQMTTTTKIYWPNIFRLLVFKITIVKYSGLQRKV